MGKAYVSQAADERKLAFEEGWEAEIKTGKGCIKMLSDAKPGDELLASFSLGSFDDPPFGLLRCSRTAKSIEQNSDSQPSTSRIVNHTTIVHITTSLPSKRVSRKRNYAVRDGVSGAKTWADSCGYPEAAEMGYRLAHNQQFACVSGKVEWFRVLACFPPHPNQGCVSGQGDHQKRERVW